MITPYLAFDAAAQGDREISATTIPKKSLPPHVVEELLYTSQLFRRAEKAVTAQLDALRGDGVDLDGFAARAVCFDLARLALLASIAAKTAMEARANGL